MADQLSPGTLIFRAAVETRNFTFEGYGLTQGEARDTCMEAWERHCARTPSADPAYVTLDDVEVQPFALGRPYRDGTDIGD